MVPRYPVGLRPDDEFRPATIPRPDDARRDEAAPRPDAALRSANVTQPDAAPASAKSPQPDAARYDAVPRPNAAQGAHAQGPRAAPVTGAYPGRVNGQRSSSETGSRVRRAIDSLPDARNGTRSDLASGGSRDVASGGSRDVANGAWPDRANGGPADLPNGRLVRSQYAAPLEFETHPVPAPAQPEPPGQVPAPDHLADYGSSPHQEASDDTAPLPVVLPGGSARETDPSPDSAHGSGSPGYQAESAASA
jgi:hypothetical protein